MSSRLFQSLAIVCVAAILGLSVAKVSTADPLTFSVGAAAIAAIAVGIATLFRKSTTSFETTTPPRKLLGMRIGMVGGVIALCGWLVAVFLSAMVGYYIAVLGVVTGLVGFPIHFYNMYRT